MTQELAQSVAYTYDDRGRLTRVVNARGRALVYAYEASTGYDALNRLAALTIKYLPGGDRTLAYDYDRYGNRDELVFTDGTDVLTHTWTFDKLDPLTCLPQAGPDRVLGSR